jgi:hypothetical protein
MPEAGWLLLFLFLGVCALVVVALMWTPFRNTPHIKAVDETRAFKTKAPTSPRINQTVRTVQA